MTEDKKTQEALNVVVNALFDRKKCGIFRISRIHIFVFLVLIDDCALKMKTISEIPEHCIKEAAPPTTNGTELSYSELFCLALIFIDL